MDKVFIVMRILLYVSIGFAAYVLFSTLFKVHNFKVWVILIPFILLEGLVLWLKERRKEKKVNQQRDAPRYNDKDDE